MLKKGDKIRVISGGNTEKRGDIVEIQCSNEYGSVYLYDNTDPRAGGSICSCGLRHYWVLKKDEYEIIKTNSLKNMNLIEKAALAFKSEPEKSFIKAGVLDSSGMPTSDGIKLVVAYLLKQAEFSKTFKTDVVDPVLAEEKE